MKVGEHSVKLEVIDNKLEEQGQQITQLNAQMAALAQFQGGIPSLSADHPIRQHSERARAHMREYRWAEAEKEIELALSESTTPSQRAALHNLLGLALHGPSNFDGALTAWGDSLLEARRIPDLREREEAAAANLGNIGTVLRIKGDLDGALKNSKDALTINERIGRPEGRANNLGNIGNVLAIKGDLAGALKYFNDALAINERIGSLEGQAIALSDIGTVLRIKGDLDGALHQHQRALALNEQIDHLKGRANNLGNIGNVLATKGDLDGALDHHHSALALNEQIGCLEGQANQLGNIGMDLRLKGDQDGALEHYHRSLAVFEHMGAGASPQAHHLRQLIAEVEGQNKT